MNIRKKSILAALTLGTIVGLAGCASSRPAPVGTPTTAMVDDSPGAVATPGAADDEARGAQVASADDGTITLNVAGLSCPQCATNIDLTVKRVKGVSGVEVDLGAGQVRVSMLPGQSASRAQIERAVRDAGFEVID